MEYWEILRNEYESYNISELINIHNDAGLRSPRKGKMSDKTYKKMLINNLLKEQEKYNQSINILLRKGGDINRKILAEGIKNHKFINNIFNQKYPEYKTYFP